MEIYYQLGPCTNFRATIFSEVEVSAVEGAGLTPAPLRHPAATRLVPNHPAATRLVPNSPLFCFELQF
jgi:hypothetical protein